MGRIRGSVTAIVLAIGLVASACSGDDDSDASGSEAPTTESAASSEAPATTGGATTAPADTDAPADTEAPASTEAVGVGTGEPVYGGNITIGIEADTTSAFNPTKMQCAVSCYNTVLGTVFEPLMSADESGPVGNLAASMVPNEDYTVWTITLREGITFSDGTAFNADVVIDNLNRYASGALTAAALAGLARGSDGRLVMEKLDDLTVTLASTKPWVDLPYYFTLQTGMMASPAWLDAAATNPDLDAKPVGTGPFVVDSYTPGSSTVLTAREGYWRTDAEGRELPYLDSITYRVIVDAQARLAALKTGEIDIMATSDGATVMDLMGEDDIQLVEQDKYTETLYLMLNVGTEGALLSDKRLRCALNAGLDRQFTADALGGGFPLQLSTGPFGPGAPGFLEDNDFPDFDPEAARALVEEWKADNGGATPRIIYSTTPDSTNASFAELAQQFWQDVGFDVEVKLVEQGKLITDALTGADDFIVFGWRQHGGVTLDNQYLWWHSTSAQPKGAISVNFGRIRDQVIDEALDANRAEDDPAAKQALAETINRRFAEECYTVPLYYAPWRVAATARVQNFMGQGNLPDGQTPLSLTGLYRPAGAWVVD